MLQNCDFCYDCRDCNNCFMCFGLRSKKYCFKNKQHTKEEYEKILDSYSLHTRTGLERTQNEYKEFILNYPRRFSMIRNSVNCTGDDLIRSKNTKDAFFASFSEDSRYIINGTIFKNCYDLSGGGETEYSYDAITPDQSYNNFFSIFSWKDKEIAYCWNCHSSGHLFGCSGIKKGEYSILNKRYSKEEYFKLKEKIIEHMKKTGEWGEFFPAKMSPFGYNETEALSLFPLSKEEANSYGFKWAGNIQHTKGKETIAQNNISDSIFDISDSITNEILSCESCERNYKITSQEFLFYKRMNIPIPRFCFFCRNNKRMSFRNPFKLWHRKCMKEGCQNEFETSYSPERPEIIYCEACYNKEVY